jgi:hypothetical protein
MNKYVLLAILTLVLLVHLCVHALMLLPYGMAEAGQADDNALFAIYWAFGEAVWTWWVFARQKYDLTITPARRWSAAGILLLLGGMADVWGWNLAAPYAWESGTWIAGLGTIAACRIARYALHAGAKTSLAGPGPPG